MCAWLHCSVLLLAAVTLEGGGGFLLPTVCRLLPICILPWEAPFSLQQHKEGTSFQ